MTEPLSQFVSDAAGKGLDYASIHLLARAAGFRDREIAEAFCSRQLQVPLPERRAGSSARDTFFQLLAFTALYVWVVDLVVLLFNVIDLQLPEPEETAEPRVSAIRVAIAGIVVALPLFSILWFRLVREVRANPERAGSAVRRWLTYLSLYVAVVTVLANTITLVFYLLEGQQTLRFFLKVAVLFVVAGAGFFYLTSTLRWQGESEPR